jgi:hypothetical protein
VRISAGTKNNPKEVAKAATYASNTPDDATELILSFLYLGPGSRGREMSGADITITGKTKSTMITAPLSWINVMVEPSSCSAIGANERKIAATIEATNADIARK